jgi:intracellular sulfur oxidation DsrE/DsrF family protein
MRKIACVFSIFCFAQFSAFAEPRGEFDPDSPGYVFGVTVDTAEQLDVILDRADSLREFFDPEQHGRIAIVLHGNELQLFQKENYAANMSIVDRARLLDQENIIDIKACQTMMRVLDIEQSELPDFIEQVPLAPVEIKRLQQEHGFTKL